MGEFFGFFGNRRSRSIKLPQFREIFWDISGSPRDYPEFIAEKKHLPKVWGGGHGPLPPLATPLDGSDDISEPGRNMSQKKTVGQKRRSHPTIRGRSW